MKLGNFIELAHTYCPASNLLTKPLELIVGLFSSSENFIELANGRAAYQLLEEQPDVVENPEI